MDLDVDVVAGLVVSERGHQPERPVRELHHHRRGTHVAHGLVLRDALGGSRRGDFDHLLAEEPPGDVEVMDELVLELAAR